MPPPFTGPLRFTSKFDPARPKDRVDAARLTRFRSETAQIVGYEQAVVELSDSYLRVRGGDVRVCFWAWLDHWSSHRALLSRDANTNGRAIRKWALASIASATLKMHAAGALDSATPRVVAWLGTLARQVQRDYGGRSLDRINNHDYWAGWAVALVGVLQNDRGLLDWGMSRYRLAIDSVDEQGFLPGELKRGRLSLEYHNFAVQPLIMLAETGMRNDVDLYRLRDGALHRLVAVIADGIRDPESFAERAGLSRVEPVESPYSLVWAVPYALRYPDSPIDPDALGPSSKRATRLGGDLALSFGAHIAAPAGS